MNYPKILLLFFVILLLFFVGVAVKVNYIQNDDYIHYQAVTSFLSGNFVLPSYLGSNFYAMGFLATVFSVFFGAEKLPVLTAVLAVLCVFIFSLILVKHKKLDRSSVFLISLLFLVNPLFIYSSFGFMTEIYFLFFFLLSIYFVQEYEISPTFKNLFLVNLFVLLSFMVRQAGIVTLGAFLLFLLLRKEYRHALWQLVFTAATVFFYSQFFPFTPQMHANPLSFGNILNPAYFWSFLFIILVYVSLFSFPLLIFKSSKRYIWLILSLGLVFCIHTKLPSTLHFASENQTGVFLSISTNNTFPYLPNVFTKKGFIPDNLSYGTKYSFNNSYLLFKALEFFGRIGATAFLVLGVFSLVKKRSFESILFLVFVAFLFFMPKIYDRYLLPLFPISLLMLSQNIKSGVSKVLCVIFILVFGFISYLYFSDYFLVNKFMWDKSQEIVKSKKAEKNQILADHSWRQTYPNSNGKWTYFFVYRGSDKTRGKGFEIVEKKKIDFMFNVFGDSFVYLVKRF